MASLKVAVTASGRFFCAGHCFGPEEQIVVLEDTPDRSLASKLAELNAAAVGRRLEFNGLDRGNPPVQSAGVLSYRIIEEPPPVVVEVVVQPVVEPEPEAPPVVEAECDDPA